MKILQVASIDLTLTNKVLPLTDWLRSEKHVVEMACADTGHADLLRERGYTVHVIAFERKLFSLAHFTAFFQMHRLLKEGHFDVIHIHTPVAAWISRLAAVIAGVGTVIYTARGFYFHENMNPLVRRFYILLERSLCRWATDWLFTVSEEDARFATDNSFMRNGHILWISNGVNLKKFAPKDPQPEIRSELGIGPEDKVVGFIGRIVREKGILDLLEALGGVASRLPGTRLLIVGETLSSDRDAKAKQEVKSSIEARNLSGSVIFTGFRKDIPELISIMDVYVLPSYREGMPMTVIEAMVSGKPVVVTDIRGCREEVVEGVTGFIVPIKDPAKLRESILKILADEDLARRMGEAGHTRAVELYDEHKVAARQMVVFREIAAGLEGRNG